MTPQEVQAVAISIVGWLGGGLVVVTAVGAAAWAMFRTWSDKWLESKFNARLEALKTAGQVEIARLKFEIDSKMDRAVKLHEKEFETLSIAWDLLSIMMGSAAGIVSSFKTYADVSRMNTDELNVVLATTNFPDHEKATLHMLKLRDRAKHFQRLVDVAQLEQAFKDRTNYHNYIIQRGIFVQPPLRAKMMELSALIQDALITHNHISADDYPPPRPFAENGAKVNDSGKALMREIETTISNRVWDAKSLEEI